MALDIDWGSLNDSSIVQTPTGPQVNAPIVSVSSANEFKNTDPELSSAFQKADEAWFAKTGQHIPVTSAARSREKQKEIFERSKKGEKGIYMPVNPDDHPEKEMFHTDALDIPENIPESFLNQYGIHRPLGKADPVHAKLMQPNKSSNLNPISSAQANEDDSKYNIDWKSLSGTDNNTDNNVETESPVGRGFVPKNALESFFSGAKTGGMQSLVGIPQMASNAILGTSAPSSKFLNETATTLEKENEPYSKSHPGYNIAGEIVGATPSALMPIGEIKAGAGVLKNIGQASLGGTTAGIMQGVPDVENGVDYWTKKAEQAVLGGVLGPIGYGAGKLVGKAIGTGYDLGTKAGNFIKKQFAEKGGNVAATVDPAVEAAVTAGMSDETQAAIASASPQLKQKIIEDVKAGKVLDENAATLHSKDSTLNHSLSLTDAQAKRDPYMVSEERENRAVNKFNEHQNHQNKQALENVNSFIHEFTPDVKDSGHFSTGEEQIKALTVKADALKKSITKAYEDVANANGGKLPIDSINFADNALAKLKANDDIDHLEGHWILKRLEKYQSGQKQMNFNQFENLRSEIAREQRASTNGNFIHAMSLIRSELERLPIQGETAATKQLADKARSLAKYEKDLQDKNSSIYNKVYDDLQSNKLKPDNFNSSNIINSSNQDLNRYISLIHDDPVAMQHLKAGVLNQLKTESTSAKGDFLVNKYNGLLNKLESNKKLEIIFTPEEIVKMKNFGEVADAAFNLPVGHHVSMSGTGASVRAAPPTQTENALGSLAAASIDASTGLPIASVARHASKVAEEGEAAAQQAMNIKKKYETFAGMSGENPRAKFVKQTLPRKLEKMGAYGVGGGAAKPVATNIIDLLSAGKEQK